MKTVLLSIIIILIILIIYHRKETLVSQDTRTFYELTDGEKIQRLIDDYFTGAEDKESGPNSNKIAKDNAYINSLPLDDKSCSDLYDDCGKWAANNECIINPEYMLYNCPKSCKACALNAQQKYNLVKIHNTREPPNCVFHEETVRSYPAPERYIREFENYYNGNVLI